MEHFFILFDNTRFSITEVTFFILLIAVVIANYKDGHRIYLATVLFSMKVIDLSIRPLLPWNLIVSQSAYFILNLVTVMLIIYRISIINWLQSTTSIRLPLFNNDNMAKEQGAITHIYFAVAALCFAMILEHVVRHPDLVHLPSDWAIQTQLIYDSYPIIVNVYTYILLIVLFIMTIDGWAIRKMRAMEEKRNAKKRLD